jgi:hypothetical protein
MSAQKRLKEEDLRKFYQDIIRLNREAFDGGEFDVSYHLLMAALHCSQDLADIQRLEEVGKLAKEQLTWIDAHAPEYDHSTEASAKRGHPNIFQNLISQVRARQTLIRNESKIQAPEQSS